jgi:hypothetical protein
MAETNENKQSLMEKAADSDLVAGFNRVKSHLSDHWLRYFAVLVTGTLTGIAGWQLTHNVIYVIFMILLAEGASLFWTARAEKNGNNTQMTMSVIGTVVAWTAIILTDLASATIIANLANDAAIAKAVANGQTAESVKLIFSLFKEVPGWAQGVITYVLPVLATLHGLLTVVHYYFSEEAKLKRDIDKIERKAKREIAQAEADARKNIAQARADRYREIAIEKAPELGKREGEKAWDKQHGRRTTDVQTTLEEDKFVEQIEGNLLEIKQGNNGANPTVGGQKK